MIRLIARRLTLALALVATTLAAVTEPLAAQTLLFGLEGGQRSDSHLNGISQSSYFGGMNLTAVIAGPAGKNAALLIPLSGEFRYSDKGYVDVNAFGDLALRLGALTAGAGLAFSWGSTPDIPDFVNGTREDVTVLNPMAFGYSGSAKLNFGPQGRAFVQGRYTVLPAAYAFHYRTAEVEQYRADNNIPLEDVTQRDSHGLRAAIGYTFGRKILRLSMMQEDWRFDRVYDNANGAYDRNARVFSLGMVWF